MEYDVYNNIKQNLLSYKLIYDPLQKSSCFTYNK